MITDDVVTDLADCLRQQYDFISHSTTNSFANENYVAQVRDSTISVASVIAKHNPTYDIDEFYERAGYTGGHPIPFPFDGFPYSNLKETSDKTDSSDG